MRNLRGDKSHQPANYGRTVPAGRESKRRAISVVLDFNLWEKSRPPEMGAPPTHRWATIPRISDAGLDEFGKTTQQTSRTACYLRRPLRIFFSDVNSSAVTPFFAQRSNLDSWTGACNSPQRTVYITSLGTKAVFQKPLAGRTLNGRIFLTAQPLRNRGRSTRYTFPGGSRHEKSRAHWRPELPSPSAFSFFFFFERFAFSLADRAIYTGRRSGYTTRIATVPSIPGIDQTAVELANSGFAVLLLYAGP